MAAEAQLPPLMIKALAVLVFVCAAVSFALIYYTIDTETFTVVYNYLSACGPLIPTYGPSDTENPALNIFYMHIFFMALAFALLGPIGAIVYVLLEDTLGVRHVYAKLVHGLIQLGALISSVLGFLEMYQKHLGSCDGAFHFQSLHSHIGIVVLACYWLQWLLGAAFFSNNSLLPEGTTGRALFHKVHISFGALCVLLGLGTVITGLLVFGGKLPHPADQRLDPTKFEQQYKGVRAGMFTFGTAFSLGLLLAMKPPRVKTSKSDETEATAHLEEVAPP